MPLYEYECFVCHRRFQRIQKVADNPVGACPTCGGGVRRLLGVPALQFKGSGWYVTDYGKGNGSSRPKDRQKEEKAASSSSSTVKKDTSDASSTAAKTAKAAS